MIAVEIKLPGRQRFKTFYFISGLILVGFVNFQNIINKLVL